MADSSFRRSEPVGLCNGVRVVPVFRYREALAGALDITVEELEAAQQEAHGVVIEQAVEEGIISQEQADQILSHPRAGLPGHGRAGCPRGFGQPGGFRPFQENNGV